MSGFGEALARYRDEAGLNQRELGAAIGLDSTQVNKIERGHRPPLGAKYMKPLVRALRLDKNEALKLVGLAGLSPKVLEFPEEALTPLHPRIPRKEDAQPDIHARRLPPKKGGGVKRPIGPTPSPKQPAAPMSTMANPALSLPDLLLYITFEQIQTLIEPKHFSEEELERFATGLLESAEMLSKVIKPQYEE